MDINDQQELDDIANHVVNIRDNDVFVPTDMSNHELITNDQPNTSQIAYLVVDTNFILSHLPLLDRLEKLLHTEYIGAYQIVIPKQVVHELDGLKESRGSSSRSSGSSSISSKHSMENLARSAIDWCYAHFHESIPTVTGQRLHERIDRNATKDNAILDCCLYFQNVENGGHNMVVLLSNDKNLCVKALVNNILTISYRNDMTAELIASNVVTEMMNNYNYNMNNNNNQHQQQHQQQTQQLQHYIDSDVMGIESYHQYSQPVQPQREPPKQLTFKDVSDDIYSQVTQLVLEAIKYAVESIFGDDVDMVGYHDDQIRTLSDAARCIIKMGLSTFSEFFDRRRFNPMKMLEDRESSRLFIIEPHNKFILKEFVAFWTEFLEGIYKNRESSQKSALSQISKHWQNLIKSV